MQSVQSRFSGRPGFYSWIQVINSILLWHVVYTTVYNMVTEQHEMQKAMIQGIPKSMYYMPNFVTMEEEASLLSAIHDLPSTKWTVLAHRRLISLPSQLTGTRRDTLIQAPMPDFLSNPVLARFQTLDIFQRSPHSVPNHCLVNEYQSGQGIMPHEDGPAYHPITATVTLGSHTVLDVYEKDANGDRDQIPTWRILQEPRSLLVTADDMYKDTLHGIKEIDCDEELEPGSIANWDLLGDASAYEERQAVRTTRISLTYRDVLKVSKLGGALKFMARK